MLLHDPNICSRETSIPFRIMCAADFPTLGMVSTPNTHDRNCDSISQLTFQPLDPSPPFRSTSTVLYVLIIYQVVRLRSCVVIDLQYQCGLHMPRGTPAIPSPTRLFANATSRYARPTPQPSVPLATNGCHR